LGIKLDGLTNFSVAKIHKWLSNFVIDNIEHKSIAREQWFDFDDIKN
jgi:hypothetical protein